MPKPKSHIEIAASVEAQKKYRNETAAARALGIARSTHQGRLQQAEIINAAPRGRKHLELRDGIILVGSDAHYWPGEPSTAHRAFVKFCHDFEPAIVVMNGDVLDLSGISRHPPIGWESFPTVQEEMLVAQERLGEIEAAAGKAHRVWTLGNHDARFATRLAQVAPEFKNIHGTELQDHFPNWTPAWSLFVNDDSSGLVIKHRFKGGQHANFNNALWAGRSHISGHLHSAKCTPITDYNGTRYGVDTGCLADPYADAFQGYTEDNARNHRSGFAVCTIVNGLLLMPELVLVVEPGIVQFRGALISV